MKKILYVIRQTGSTGGVERRVEQLYQASKTQEEEVEVFSFLGKLETYSTGRGSKADYFKRLMRFYQKVKAFRPDLIHAFDLESGIYSAVVIKMFPFRKIRLISGYGAEKVTDDRIAKLLSYSFFQPERFACNSNPGANSLREVTGNSVPVHVIYNGIRLPEHEPPDVPVWTGKGQTIIGCISKFDVYKRADRVFELVDRLPGDLDYHFVVVGTGSQFDEARTQWEGSSRYRQNITLLGVQPEAWRLIPWFDIGMLVSDSEGFPTVLLEFMNFNKPVISTAAGETEVILDGGKAGVLQKEWHVKAFAAQLEELIRDPEKRERIGRRGNARLQEQFTFEAMKNAYFQLYA